MKKFLVGLVFILTASVYSQAPFGNYISIGPNGYLVNTDTLLAPGASEVPHGLPLTIECFFKMSSFATEHPNVVNMGPAWFPGLSGGVPNPRLAYLNTSASWVNSGIGAPPGYDYLQWSHFVMEIYMSGGQYYISIGVDGDCIRRQQIHASYTAYYQNGSNIGFFIGHDFHPLVNYDEGFYGFMDEFRYSSGQRYNLDFPAVGAYTVPTNEFIPDGNTRFLLHFNETPGATVASDTSGFNRDFLIEQDAFISGPAGLYTDNGFVSYDTICYGEQIYAQGGNQVTWTPSFGISNQVWDPVITADDTIITYVAFIEDLNTGASAYDTITLFIPPKPYLGPDTTTCFGATVTLQLDPGLVPLVWSDGSTATSIVLDSSGAYFVNTYGFGCTQSDTMLFSTYTSSFDLGNDTTICMNASFYLSAGNIWDSILWSNGSTDTSIIVFTPGTYSAQAMDSASCFYYDTINIAGYPLLNLDLGNDTSICLNDTLFLNAGNIWASINWWDSGTDTIHSVLTPGNYFVEVTDSNACEYFDTVVVAGDFLLDLNLGNDTSLCYNQFLFYNIGNSWSNITWWDGSHDTVQTITASTGIYFVETTDLFYCQHFDTIQVTAYPVFNLDLGNDTSICPGDTVHLNVGSVWSSILWNDATTDTINQIIDAGTYFVETVDSNSCSYSDTIIVNNNPVNISGFAYSSDSIALTNTPVYFVLADSSNFILALDSTLTDNFGFFSINTNMLDFSILIKPDSSIYPGEMPTYFDSSVTIQNSNLFMLNACDSVSLDIYSVPGVNPGGPCFVGGTIVYGGRAVNGDPVPGVKVIFVDASDHILGYTYANSAGYFYMDNLPSGDIRFWVDWPEIDNTLAPVLTISPGSNFINVYFELYPSELILMTASLETPEIESSTDVIIYPNPIIESLQIQLPSDETGELYLLNDLGVILLTQPVANFSKIDMREFTKGVYFVMIRIGDKQLVKKVIKM